MAYRVEPVDFSAAHRARPEWRRRMNPVGKVPVMTCGTSFKMYESGAMVQHLLDAYDHEQKLQPERGTDNHGIFLQWCWFAEATFCRATGEIANHRREFAGALLEPVLEEMRNRARECMRALDAALADGRSYLMGDAFTAADIMMGYAFVSFERNVGNEALPPNAERYWRRLKARPAYQRALEANLCKAS